MEDGQRDGQGVRREDRDEAAALSREWIVPFLLLCLRDEGSWGYRLEEKLGEFGFDGMRSGETYRTLWKMEREGLVLCNREGGGYRLPQRWYETTRAGEAYLEFWANSLTDYREGIDRFLASYAERDGRESHG